MFFNFLHWELIRKVKFYTLLLDIVLNLGRGLIGNQNGKEFLIKCDFYDVEVFQEAIYISLFKLGFAFAYHKKLFTILSGLTNNVHFKVSARTNLYRVPF